MNSSIEGRILPVIRRRNRPLPTESKVATTVAEVRCGGSPQGHLGDHAEVPSLPTKSLVRLQAGDVLQSRSTKAHDGAVGKHHL